MQTKQMMAKAIDVSQHYPRGNFFVIIFLLRAMLYTTSMVLFREQRAIQDCLEIGSITKLIEAKVAAGNPIPFSEIPYFRSIRSKLFRYRDPFAPALKIHLQRAGISRILPPSSSAIPQGQVISQVLLAQFLPFEKEEGDQVDQKIYLVHALAALEELG